MRNARLARASFVFAIGGCMIAGAASAREGASRDAAPPERGEIVIKRTGRTRVTRTAASPTTRPAPAEQLEPVKDLPYEGRGPRSVTIGYFVRDPGETGWGPQVYEGYPAYSHYGDYGYGGYGYLGGYGYGGCGYGGSYLGSSSYCGPSSFFGSSYHGGSSGPVSVGRIGR
jgi:hypothetical protein